MSINRRRTAYQSFPRLSSINDMRYLTKTPVNAPNYAAVIDTPSNTEEAYWNSTLVGWLDKEE